MTNMYILINDTYCTYSRENQKQDMDVSDVLHITARVKIKTKDELTQKREMPFVFCR